MLTDWCVGENVTNSGGISGTLTLEANGVVIIYSKIHVTEEGCYGGIVMSWCCGIVSCHHFKTCSALGVLAVTELTLATRVTHVDPHAGAKVKHEQVPHHLVQVISAIYIQTVKVREVHAAVARSGIKRRSTTPQPMPCTSLAIIFREGASIAIVTLVTLAIWCWVRVTVGRWWLAAAAMVLCHTTVFGTALILTSSTRIERVTLTLVVDTFTTTRAVQWAVCRSTSLYQSLLKLSLNKTIKKKCSNAAMLDILHH